MLQHLQEKALTKENILKYIQPYDVYFFYLAGSDIEIATGKIQSSPFRKDDNPSFGFFIGSRTNELCFNDFKLGGGDFVRFVMLVENVDRRNALIIIKRLFNLPLEEYKNTNSYKSQQTPIIHKEKMIVKAKESALIKIRIRKWTKEDKEYFSPLKLSKLHKTFPISHFWVNTYMFKAKGLAYAYRYAAGIYKIYQPQLTIKEGKWASNISVNTPWYGEELLPEKGELLFITSSNKDANVLMQIGFYAIAPHTEAQIFSEEQYNKYSKRFKKIIVFYDNDETGIQKAEYFCQVYNLTYIALEEEDTKDPFEFIKKYDLESLKEWIIQWI